MKNYFFFSRKERLGIVVLLLLCAAIFAVPSIRENFAAARKTDFSGFEQGMSFQAAPQKDEAPVRAFAFNPNEAEFEDFIRLGLPEKVARNICNYRAKGGQFRKPEDFKKIWGLSPADFERLAPFIRLESPNKHFADAGDEDERMDKPQHAAFAGYHFPAEKKKQNTGPFDINRVSAEALLGLPLIGEKRAQQIIRFRDKLGGFLSVEQLAEMNYLPDSVFQIIRNFFTLETPVFRRINLNTATQEEIGGHPYISTKQAGLIVAYREQHGAFTSVDEVLKIKAFQDKNWWAKVLPYLSVE